MNWVIVNSLDFDERLASLGLLRLLWLLDYLLMLRQTLDLVHAEVSVLLGFVLARGLLGQIDLALTSPSLVLFELL